MKYNFIIFLFFVLPKLNAQTEHGYLLRCYTSSGGRDTTIYYQSSMFLDSAEFNKQEFESYSASYPEYHFYIEEHLAKFFHNTLSFIVTVARKKDTADTSCFVGKPVSLSDISRKRSFEYILKVGKNFTYKFYIDKVDAAFCKMIKYSEDDNPFRDLIALQQRPVFLNLSDTEKEKFTAVFGKFRIVVHRK